MSAAADTSVSLRAGAREWLGLAVLVLPSMLLAIDLTALHLALPHLAADLGAENAQQLWILDIYGFMIAGFLITMGTLGDRIGRRRLLMIGAAAFGIVSAVAAYSPNPETLILSRALLGVAGATLMPSTLSLLRNMFLDAKQRAVAIAVWTASLMSGIALGPVVGGLLLEWFWWGSVFLIGVPVMALLLISGPFLLPEYRDPVPGRIDLTSVALSLAAILPFIYALKETATNGWQPATAAALAVALPSGWLFVRRQRRLDSPLVDLRLFRYRAFSVGLGSMLMCAVVMGAFTLVFAQYLQMVQGFGPAQAGLWMVPHALVSIVALLTTPAIAARLGNSRTIAGGLALSAAGFVLFSQIPPAAGPELSVLAAMLVSIGTSPLMVLVITLVIAAAPKERSGSASSMSETCSELGVSLGIATLGALTTAVYRFRIADTVPEGTPAPAAEAARDSLAGAAGAAEGLPEEPAAALMSAAGNAFMSGLGAVGYTSAAIMLVLAVLTGLFLEQSGVSSGGEQEEQESAPPPEAGVATDREITPAP